MQHPFVQWPAPEIVEDLVANAHSGRAADVEALLAGLRPALLSFFARRLPADMAEDLAQLALVRIHRALPHIEPARADRFVVTVACNLVRSAFTTRGREMGRWAPGELADHVTSESTADRHVEYAELALAVRNVTKASLSPATRDVILGLLRGETPAEIAERLRISPVTVRTRLMRARSVLRRELAAFFDGYPTQEHRVS